MLNQIDIQNIIAIANYNFQQCIIFFSIKLSNAIVKLTQACGIREKHSI